MNIVVEGHKLKKYYLGINLKFQKNRFN
jgi:hypothetical protein